jgi:hypothetical protein
LKRGERTKYERYIGFFLNLSLQDPSPSHVLVCPQGIRDEERVGSKYPNNNSLSLGGERAG